MQITTSAQAAQRDADAIGAGHDSFLLMLMAGNQAGHFIEKLAERVEANGVLVWTGAGNNGGDAYIVAHYLYQHVKIPITVAESAPPKTPDAKRAREECMQARAGWLWPINDDPKDDQPPQSSAFIIVDGVLGTGQQGELRAAERELCAKVPEYRAHGGIVVALDVPTGVNATTGEIAEGAVKADYTIAFGTMKRAHVLAREQCGEVIVVDIGLGDFANKADGAWTLADETMLKSRVPKIQSTAHKGTRGRVAIVGGDRGMAGAVVLASEAALRSGAGLLHAHVNAASVLPLQVAVPQAIAHELSQENLRVQLESMNAIVAGPGFGRSAEAQGLLKTLLEILRNDSLGAAVVLDADALTLIGSDRAQLKALASLRTVVCTPHVGEFARLLGKPAAETLVDRIAQAEELVAATGITLLLKGTPTIVVAPNANTVVVVPRGTPVLATGGSGDMLSGMIGALLAQGASGTDAASIAAWVHGRAAEFATESAGTIRGVTLREVMSALPHAWRELSLRSTSTHNTRSAFDDSNSDTSVHNFWSPLSRLPRVWSDA